MSRLDGTDGLEESSARQRLSQGQCRVGWSPPISRTPPGFELSAPFVFLDTTPFAGSVQERVVRESRTLRAMWRGLETDLRCG